MPVICTVSPATARVTFLPSHNTCLIFPNSSPITHTLPTWKDPQRTMVLIAVPTPSRMLLSNTTPSPRAYA